MTTQFKDFLRELEPLPIWARNDMHKIQNLDRAKVDAQNLIHRVARNFFQFSEKNKKRAEALAKEKKRATDKIKTLQQKIQVMSCQKVDLATKLMKYAELNLDQIVKDQAKATAAAMSLNGAKNRRE